MFYNNIKVLKRIGIGLETMLYWQQIYWRDSVWEVSEVGNLFIEWRDIPNFDYYFNKFHNMQQTSSLDPNISLSGYDVYKEE